MLIPYGLHESIGEAWKKVNLALDWEDQKKNTVRGSGYVIVVLCFRFPILK